MIDKELKIYDSVCTGCSACTEACPFLDETGVSPIKLIVNEKGLKVPRINAATCKKCMLCYQACPGEDKIFNNDVTFESYQSKIGDCYFGYALDEDHRFKSATAGIVTEIAAYLLDTQQVDGVVSSYQQEDNQIITEIFTDSSEVKKTSGSIYRQVPLLNGLAKKIKEGNYTKLLVIGLPCHISALRSLQKVDKHLAEVDFTTIALFCKQTKTEEFSDIERTFLLAKPKQKIDYRGNGWPGVTQVEGGRSLPSNNVNLSLMWGAFAFTPDYCFACSDPLGVVADISVGDAWLRKYYGDKMGSSIFAANSEKGKLIIEEMLKSAKICVEKETVGNIVKSQSVGHVRFKTTFLKERGKLWGNISGHADSLDDDVFLFRWIKFNKKFVEIMYGTSVIKFVPDILLKIYGRINIFIFKKLIRK